MIQAKQIQHLKKLALLKKVNKRGIYFEKNTQDEWYGNDIVNGIRVVEVGFLRLDENEYRVCVWGNDDFGWEKDGPNKAELFRLFRTILSWPYVNIQPLKDLGFNPA